LLAYKGKGEQSSRGELYLVQREGVFGVKSILGRQSISEVGNGDGQLDDIFQEFDG
jgi:hypothetical protein